MGKLKVINPNKSTILEDKRDINKIIIVVNIRDDDGDTPTY